MSAPLPSVPPGQPDPEIMAKVLQNRYILGMSEFSLCVLFNTIALFAIFTSGIIRQSTGFYLLLLLLSDLFYMTCTVFMEEFYNPLIDLDVFWESGDPIRLCQAIYFLREAFYYWRWILLFILVVDRSLYASGVEMSRLRIGSWICWLASLAVAGGLAGYWVYWVKEELYGGTDDPAAYTNYSCRFTLAPIPVDKSSTWFLMEAIVHILFPDGFMLLLLFIGSSILLLRLRTKAAESLDGDDFNFTKAIVALAFINILMQIPYVLVNCVFLYVRRVWRPQAYEDFSDTVKENLAYAGAITNKAKDLSMCLTFFMLLFARMFRAAFCKI